MTRARRALLVGLAVTGLYVATAAVSGRIAPVVRRPLLDGLSTQVPYNWVSPPPALAPKNKSPQPVTVTLPLSASGSGAKVVNTPDAQATFIVTKGLIPAAAGQDQVTITWTPLDPAPFPGAPPGLTIAGNVYRFRATYEPGGDPVKAFANPAVVVLTYPALSGGQHPGTTLLYSSTGKAWETVKSINVPGLFQAQGPIPAPGYVVAATPPLPTVGPSPASSGGGTSPVVIGLVVAAVLALLLAGFMARRRRGPR